MKSRREKNQEPNKALQAGTNALKGLGQTVASIPDKETTNSKVAYAASAVSAFGMGISWLTNSTACYYYCMAAALTELGVGLNQAGYLEPIKPTVRNALTAIGLFKAEEKKTEEVEMKNAAKAEEDEEERLDTSLAASPAR